MTTLISLQGLKKKIENKKYKKEDKISIKTSNTVESKLRAH